MFIPLREWRYAARHLMSHRGTAVAAVLSLAVGMAAMATTVTWVDHLLLRPLPGVPQVRGIFVMLSHSTSGSPGNISAPDYSDLRSAIGDVADVAGTSTWPVTLSTESSNPAQRVFVEFVSDNYFSTLDVRPAAGRLFAASESTRPGREPVVVVSHEMWVRRFGSDPALLGKVIRLNGSPFTVIGIMGPEFLGGFVATSTDLWVPLTMEQGLIGRNLLVSRGARWLQGLVRLRPPATSRELDARIDAASAHLDADYASIESGRGFSATPLWRSPAGAQAVFRPALFALAGLAVLLLALAVTNVANLLLAGLIQRRGELSVRLALGSGRAGVIGPALAEALLLAIAAAIVGLALTYEAAPLLRLFRPPVAFSVHFETAVNRLTLEVLGGLMILVAAIVGLVPGISVLRTPIIHVLRAESGSFTGGSAKRRVSDGLAVLQVAMCVAVLVGVALSLRSLNRAMHTPVGFEPVGVVVANYDLTPYHYSDADGIAAQRRIVDQIEGSPGVSFVSTVATVPFAMDGEMVAPMQVDGYEPHPGEDMDARVNIVGAQYFRTMRIAFSKGREFDDHDDARSQRVAIVSDALASRYWPGASPLGRTLRVYGQSVQIVGVAKDVRYATLGGAPPLELYLPSAQRYRAAAALEIRTVDPAGAIAAVRRAVSQLGPIPLVVNFTRLTDQMQSATFMPRFATSLSLVLAIPCVLLTAVGIFSLLACMIAARRMEIALRVALGAQRADVIRMVLGHAGLVTAAGLGLGVPAGWACASLLSATLVGITVSDAVSWAGAVVAVLAIAALASAVATARATRITAVAAMGRLKP